MFLGLAQRRISLSFNATSYNKWKCFVWIDNEDEGEKFKQQINKDEWQNWWDFEVRDASQKEIIEYFTKI